MWLCSQCGKPFNSCLKLLQHRRVHSVYRPFICYVGQCTKSFSSVSAYQCHRRRHVDHRLYGCGRCRLKFLTLLHRQQHNCGTKVNTCNICHQRFHHVLPLKYHIKLEHPSAQRIISSKSELSSVRRRNKNSDKSLLSLHSARYNSNKVKPTEGCDKDGNKILLKITAGKSTTIISPKSVRRKKSSDDYQKKKSKKKQKRHDKEKKNGIILSIKNIPELKKAYVCKKVNGLPVKKEPVKQVGDLKLKIKTYPSLTVEQNIVKINKKTVSDEGPCESSPKSISARASNNSEKFYAERERTPNRKLLSESLSQSPSPSAGESKVRNGIVIVKDKSGRFQAEQLQSSKMRKRDRDNVFDSFSDIGVWKVMPSPRTDHPTDILKLRLSPQKPLRLDSGLDQTFESAAARYLDVSVKTKAVYNSGDDSDIFESAMVLDKDSENGGQGVNDSGIEVLSSSTIRSNGNSVHSGILDESSPNYLNTEDSLLSIDSPVAEALSKSEHTLCHKCGGIIIETNNNAYSPRRCRCYMSNPNSPFQTPMSPMKNSTQLSESVERSYFDNKRKAFPQIQRGSSEEEDKPFDTVIVEQNTDLPETDSTFDNLNESVLSGVRTAETVCKSPSKRGTGDSKNEGESLCLKIQLGDNPSVERLSERRSPRKQSPDKHSRQKSPEKTKLKSELKQRLNKHRENSALIETFDHKELLKDKDDTANSRLNVSQVITIDSDNEDIENTQDLTIQDSTDLFPSSQCLPGHKSAEELDCVIISSCEMRKNEKKLAQRDEKTVSDDIEKSLTETCSEKDQSVEKTINSQENTSLPGLLKAKVSPQKSKDNILASQEKDNFTAAKKKPLFKKNKSSQDNDIDSAILTQKSETPSIEDTKSKNKKPLFKKRTHSVDAEEIAKKNKKPIFKRTVSAIETQLKDRLALGKNDINNTNKIGAENVITTKSKKSDMKDVETKSYNVKTKSEKADKKAVETVSENVKATLKKSDKKGAEIRSENVKTKSAEVNTKEIDSESDGVKNKSKKPETKEDEMGSENVKNKSKKSETKEVEIGSENVKNKSKEVDKKKVETGSEIVKHKSKKLDKKEIEIRFENVTNKSKKSDKKDVETAEGSMKNKSKEVDKKERTVSNEKASKQKMTPIEMKRSEQYKDNDKKETTDDVQLSCNKEIFHDNTRNESKKDIEPSSTKPSNSGAMEVEENICKDSPIPSNRNAEILPEIKKTVVIEEKPIITSPTIGGTCLVEDKEDSLQEVPTVIEGDDLPLSPNPKPITSPFNPFQQQFLSFLSTAIVPSNTSSQKESTSKKTKKKSTANAEKDKKEKENVHEKKEANVGPKSMQNKDKKKKNQGKTEEAQKKGDTFSWLNIFSQMNSERNEADKDEETKDDTADFKADLEVINQKMDTQKEDDSDSLDVDDIFESKNLSNLQPLQNPKDGLHSEKNVSSKDRKKSARKRKHHHSHLDSDFSSFSSEDETVDMVCCHKKHDPNFNPFMDSDDDFMPSKPVRRRESTSRRGKKFRSSRSVSRECDSKYFHDSKFQDKFETGSTISRSKRSKQGQKSCCPCCLGSFGDIGDSDEEHLVRQPSYKLPRNHKQFVKSTIRLMQLQEKIHKLFINLFPDCADLISKTKEGTEEFEALIEDVLYGLESQDVQFESSCVSSLPSTTDKPLLSPQGSSCHVQATETSQPTQALAVSDYIIPDSAHNSTEQDSIPQSSHGVILECSGMNLSDKFISEPTNMTQNDLSNPGPDDTLSDKVTTGNATCTISKTSDSIGAHSEHTLNSVEPEDQNKTQIVTANSELGDLTSAETLKQPDADVINQVNSQVIANSLQPPEGDQLILPQALDIAGPSVTFDPAVNHDDDCGFVDDSSYMDCGTSVQSHLEITIDLSAARVSVCREPKHCLQLLQGQLVKLVKYLMPELDFKNYFYRNLDNLEFLLDLLIVANDQEKQHTVAENEIVLSSDSETEVTSVKQYSTSDMIVDDKVDELKSDQKINISADKSLSVLPCISEHNKEEDTFNTIASDGSSFEMLIKSQRESLKKDVFKFEELDTAAMIKSSESVLSNIETLSNIAKCTARTKRTKSRESRLRKRTAEEKRTLFVQEKILNSQNSTIVYHSKKLPEPPSRPEKVKHSENPKQRFLSELNLGDRQDSVQNKTEQTESEKVEEKEKSTEENLLSEKQDMDDLDSESRRKSSDKNIFELMQPSQSAETVSS